MGGRVGEGRRAPKGAFSNGLPRGSGLPMRMGAAAVRALYRLFGPFR